MEPLSKPHSSRLFTRVLATTTKICITGSSSLTHVLAFNAYRHATLLVGALRLIVLTVHSEAFIATDGCASGESLSAIHFQGCSLRQD